MEVVKNSRLIFIDSEENQIGNQGRTVVQLPSQSFSVCGEDTMRLSLVSFNMRRSWHNVNQTNNKLFLLDTSANAYKPVIIATGTYKTMTSLKDAVTAALEAAATGSSCDYSDDTRTFSFTTSGTHQLVSFALSVDSTLPVGVSREAAQQETHKLLGLIPTRSSSAVLNACDSSSATAHTAPFPGSLNTLDAVYVRTNLQCTNFMTTGHDLLARRQLGAVESQILACIPIQRSSFDPIASFVTFFDSSGASTFSLNLAQKHLDGIEIYLTDAAGRLLAEVDPRQADLGLMSYKMVLQWQHLHSPFPSPPSFIPTEVPSSKSTNIALRM